MTPLRAPLACAAALALATGGCAGARPRPGPPPAPERTAFEVPGHGALEVTLPPGWTATLEEGEPPAAQTIRLAAPGGAFVGLLSPFWNPGEPEEEEARADTAQLFAELARRSALPGAVEREIALEELVGDEVHGYWFQATDRELVGKEPGPDEWRHLLQGAAAVGPLVVAFSLLDNGPGPQRERFLELVRGARHVGGEGDEADEEPAEGDEEEDGVELDVDTVPLRVEVRGRPWTVLVDLPGFRVLRPREGEDGVESLVVGQEPETGIVASVIVRAAVGARDAAACREQDLERIRAAHPDVEALRRAEEGGAARATYVQPELGGRRIPHLHAHGWLQRDDVCVNVHVSKAAPGPGDAEALERILGTVRYGADL